MNSRSKEELYLGLGKTLFNSSASVITSNQLESNEVILTERLTQKKASGAWPEFAIKHIEKSFGTNFKRISENRDVITPIQFEESLNRSLPFFSYLEKKNLQSYSSHFNEEIETLSHHICHAYAALMYSPFEQSIIIVMDGAGSKFSDFSEEFSHFNTIDFNQHEECSIFIQNGPSLSVDQKFWQTFKKSKHGNHYFSDGTGMLYEKAAEFIFNNKRAAGKVMGLSGFGQKELVQSPFTYLESLKWSNSFNGHSKAAWQSSPDMELYKNIAATVQQNYEERILNIILKIKQKYPKIDNLILTGGTALNCTSNYKLLTKKIFSNIYIPPFPSDECISFGAASYSFLNENQHLWTRKELHSQHGFLGPKTSILSEEDICNIFSDYEIIKPDNIVNFTAELLLENKIIGWFQDRSEIGPRALGNRSILANPLQHNLKEFLNKNIKFREKFRPYGCSIPQEFSSKYFEVDANFHNPYMSFACKIKTEYIDSLKEVSHIDNTSRMQTVTKEFNSKFYDLLNSFGRKSNLYCLLNTSLNIMGKPIVETVEDALSFIKSTNVDGIVIDNIYIKNKR